MTRWADPSNVQTAAEAWSDGIVHCRIYGHGWTPLTVTRDEGGTGYVVHQQCRRCDGKRHQEMDQFGHASPWRYTYGSGYLDRDLGGRINSDGRAVLRLAAIRHLTVQDAPAE